MKYYLMTAFLIALCVRDSLAQDTLGVRIRNEVFPVYSGMEATLGDGLAVEFQTKLSSASRVGISYAKMTFGESVARNAEVIFYSESRYINGVRASMGFGFFARQWSDFSPDNQDTTSSRRLYTTGYIVSLGALVRINDWVDFSARIVFNNNMDSEITYSIRPGIIIKI